MVREQFREMLSGLIESEYMHVLVLLVAAYWICVTMQRVWN